MWKAGAEPEVTRLWTIAASGGDAVPLTDGPHERLEPHLVQGWTHVFYVSNRGGSMDLWQQAVADDGSRVGEPLAVTHGLGIRSAVFSPDGSETGVHAGRKGLERLACAHPSDRPATWADAVQRDVGACLHRVRRRVAGRCSSSPSARTGAATRTSGCCRRGWRDDAAHDRPDARLESALVARRQPDCVLRVSQRQPGHLGDALPRWAGATAHRSPRG